MVDQNTEDFEYPYTLVAKISYEEATENIGT
jgi:hypothetical protein